MNLSLRLTWPGEVENDYRVCDDGEPIGRIRKVIAMGSLEGEVWAWHIQVHIPGHGRNGLAGSLDQAKADFNAAWAAVKQTMSPDDWKKEREYRQASLASLERWAG